MLLYILLGWLAFDIIVYLFMWYDSREHHFNLVETLTEIKNSFAQDE